MRKLKLTYMQAMAVVVPVGIILMSLMLSRYGMSSWQGFLLIVLAYPLAKGFGLLVRRFLVEIVDE